MKKQLEQRMTIPDGEVLRFFCIENKDSIIGCGWHQTVYCLKTCKFYKTHEQEFENKINEAKYGNRGSADNSTKV